MDNSRRSPIYDLEGDGLQSGASGGPYWYLGADALWLLPDGDIPDGMQLTGGFGIGLDMHVNNTHTGKTHTISNGSNLSRSDLSGLSHQLVSVSSVFNTVNSALSQMQFLLTTLT